MRLKIIDVNGQRSDIGTILVMKRGDRDVDWVVG